MTLSLSDAISVESFFKVTIGTPGTITDEQLTVLQAGVAEPLKNFIGNRTMSADLKTTIEACFILDKYSNRDGHGTITSETVENYSWKSAIKSSSSYMDQALYYRDNFDSILTIDTGGVEREDFRHCRGY